MVGAGSFNQHLDPCFTNSALPPPISKLSTPRPDPAGSLLDQGQTGPEMLKVSEIFLVLSSAWRLKEEMTAGYSLFYFLRISAGRDHWLAGCGMAGSFSALVWRHSAGGKLEDLKRVAKQCNVGLLDSRQNNSQTQEIRWKSCWQKKIIVKDTFL